MLDLQFREEWNRPGPALIAAHTPRDVVQERRAEEVHGEAETAADGGEGAGTRVAGEGAVDLVGGGGALPLSCVREL